MSRPPKQASFALAACAILSAIMLYDVMGAIVKHLSETYPAPQLTLLRNLFGMVPAVLILMWSTTWKAAGRPVVIRQWRLGLIRGGFGAIAQLSFYISLIHLEFATATTMLFVGPMFSTALSIPLLGHRVGGLRWLAVMIGFAGVVMVMQPGSDNFNWYAVLPLIAALGYSSANVTSQFFDTDVPTPLLNLYYNVGSIVGTLILVAYTREIVPIVGLVDWLWLLVMGCAGGLAAYLLITAYRYADPSSLSPFEFFAIPFSFTLGWVFFAEAPFERLYPGVVLIVGGGLFIIWREHNSRKPASTPTS